MNLPSADFLLIAGRAVFLVFSFIVAAISFTAWRRATQQQTAQLLSQSQIVLQRLAELEAKVDAVRSTLAALSARETYRIHLRDLGDPRAVPVDKQTYDRMRMQGASGVSMAE